MISIAHTLLTFLLIALIFACMFPIMLLTQMLKILGPFGGLLVALFTLLVLVPLVSMAAVLRIFLWDPLFVTIPEYLNAMKEASAEEMEEYKKQGIAGPVYKDVWQNLVVGLNLQRIATQEGSRLAWILVREQNALFVKALIS